MNKIGALIFLFFITKALADEYPDPFGNSGVVLGGENSFDWQLDMYSFWQTGGLREEHYLNPNNLFTFEEQQERLGFSMELENRLSKQLKGVFSGFAERTRSDEAPVEQQSEVLEAFVQWNTEQNDWYMTLGRRKLQWSNGFNWSPANLIQPFFDRPNYDPDEKLQKKGWNLFESEYRMSNASISVFIIENDEDVVDQQKYGNYQTALKYSLQAPVDISLILHKHKMGDVNSALTWSLLLSESVTVRAEIAHQVEREVHSYPEQTEKDTNGYLKSVLGVSYAYSGWDFTLEYLYNEHGYSDREWSILFQTFDEAKQNLSIGNDVTSSIQTLTQGLSLLRNGQLRQHYYYLMLSNIRENALFQYRLSHQVNLDDNSEFSRIEIFQNWSENFSSRVEWQGFSGCNQCEFGLTPQEDQFRLSLYYLF